jgi:hypothetical protein
MKFNPANGWRLCGYLFVFKAIYIGLLSTALFLWLRPEKDTTSHSYWPNRAPDQGQPVQAHFASTDGNYYLNLSEKGYQSGLSDCAFYPLYPLLIHWVSRATRLNNVLIAMVLSNLFSLAAFLLFFWNVARHYGEAVATLSLVLLIAFPGSLFFQFIYTESLFFFLLMLFCVALDRERFALALTTAFLLPLTRAVGIFCIFPLLWRLFFRSPPVWWEKLAGRQGWVGKIACFLAPRPGDLPQSKPPILGGMRSFVLVLSPLLGWATYFMLMWRWTGNPFEGIEAQKKFGVQSIHNLFDPIRFVKLLFNPTEWHAFRGSLLDRCVFVLLINCFPLIWKLDKSWCIWAFFLGVVPAVSGGFTSFTRFASVVFPLFIALAVFLSKPKLRWLRWLTLTVFATLHLILVWRFVNFRWAG